MELVVDKSYNIKGGTATNEPISVIYLGDHGENSCKLKGPAVEEIIMSRKIFLEQIIIDEVVVKESLEVVEEVIEEVIEEVVEEVVEERAEIKRPYMLLTRLEVINLSDIYRKIMKHEVCQCSLGYTADKIIELETELKNRG